MEENNEKLTEELRDEVVPAAGVDISNNEIKSISDYIKRHNTAILVIMFTDIQGFTRMTEVKGEMYSSRIRKYHDEIMVSTIEENDSGKVIKFIGDAVMAVFSEPITAVKKSLSIQRKLRKFNEEHPELDDILVRIGLHMGQVAIEDNIHADVFGRHVNRASRIEGLAAGGQVYITFPVFDSAKGWLLDDQTINWKFHGSYYLKGIDKPSEIYEVYNVGETAPAPPKNGKKVKRVVTPIVTVLVVVLLVLLGFIIANTIKQKKLEKERKKPVVSFVDHTITTRVYLDGDTTVIYMDGEKGDHMRKSLIPIDTGKHISHWNVSRMVRYYAEFFVKEGENFIELRYKHFQLPELKLYGAVRDTVPLTLNKKLTKNYSYYDKNLNLVTKSVGLEASVIGNLEGDTASYIISYDVSIDGMKPQKNKVVRKYDINSKSDSGTWNEIVRDGPVSFHYKVRVSKKYVNFYLEGRWD